ncbi:methyltransferase [Arthrobacter sp. Sa2CUA1]|uniref:Methyltransferase n=2 Tax=Arthrobacter gallicola TaxID=2762225 RepID=A0ABR8USY0_9MICC|nr:methyltransferase [Arthrobacter gallicola]
MLICRAAAESGVSVPLAAAVQLWLTGESVSPGRLDAAFPRTGAAGLLQLGLAEQDPESPDLFRAAVDLRPYAFDAADANAADANAAAADADENADAADADASARDGDAPAGSPPAASAGVQLWVASDLGAHQRPGVLPHDHVLGIGQASLSLAQLTSRRPVERALDLGTGCGIQAFHLLSHAGHVTATDISERALGFTRFNLLLNAPALDLDPARPEQRIDLRLGSMLEPVAGERFDLVVSNPPFVITPRSAAETAEGRFTYRDGGMAGDGIVEGLFRDLGSVLAPGGTAQMLGNWEIQGTDGFSDRLRSWLPETMDAWVIQRETLSPAEYAEMWLRDAAENRDKHEYAASYAAYLADFASRDTTAVGFGLVWMRRRADPDAAPLRRFEEIAHPLESPIGPHLGAAVDLFDWTAAHPDLSAEHLEVAGDVTEERHQRPGAEHPGVILLRQGAGLRRTNLMSTELTGFVSACDGELPAGAIIAALGALLGRDDPEFAAGLAAEVCNLILDGFLLPAQS